MFDNRKYTQGYIEFQFLYLIIAHSIDLILIKHRIINLQQWQQQKENTLEQSSLMLIKLNRSSAAGCASL